jgi:predicted HD phosphohydrolase
LHAGFGVSQLHHALQTATMARRANATDEVVLIALCHDVGKYVSIANHAAIAAEILQPYVSEHAYRVVLTHQDFQGRHYYEFIGLDPNARDQHKGASWYGLAQQFADDWDQISFDPDYPTKPLAHFEPMVREVFGSFTSL